jgi:hypothetical protein
VPAVTPYPHEDTGWTIANTSPNVCLFSSDFPHVEGGRNPIARFERSMDAWREIHGLQSRLVLAEGFVRAESIMRIQPGAHVAPSSITPIRKSGCHMSSRR